MKDLSKFIVESVEDEATIKKEAKKLFKMLIPGYRFPKWRSVQRKPGVYVCDPRNAKLNKHLCDSLNVMCEERGIDYIEIPIGPGIWGEWEDSVIYDMFGKNFDKVYQKNGLYAGIERWVAGSKETPLFRKMWIWYPWS